jgi:OTU-like cysteine protease
LIFEEKMGRKNRNKRQQFRGGETKWVSGSGPFAMDIGLQRALERSRRTAHAERMPSASMKSDEEMELLRQEQRKEEEFLEHGLEEAGMKRIRIPKDGACLFRAVSWHLYDGSQLEHLALRRRTVEALQVHKDLFMPFVCEEDSQYERYLRTMALPTAWAGNVELQAISVCFEVNFRIYSKHQMPVPMEYDNGFERSIDLCFSHGNHYDVVLPIEQFHRIALCQSIVYELLAKAMPKAKANAAKDVVDSESIGSPFLFVNVGMRCWHRTKRSQERLDRELAREVAATSSKAAASSSSPAAARGRKPSAIAAAADGEWTTVDAKSGRKPRGRRAAPAGTAAAADGGDVVDADNVLKAVRQSLELEKQQREQIGDAIVNKDSSLFPSLAPNSKKKQSSAPEHIETAVAEPTQVPVEAAEAAATAPSQAVAGGGGGWGVKKDWSTILAAPTLPRGEAAAPVRRDQRVQRVGGAESSSGANNKYRNSDGDILFDAIYGDAAFVYPAPPKGLTESQRKRYRKKRNVVARRFLEDCEQALRKDEKEQGEDERQDAKQDERQGKGQSDDAQESEKESAAKDDSQVVDVQSAVLAHIGPEQQQQQLDQNFADLNRRRRLQEQQEREEREEREEPPQRQQIPQTAPQYQQQQFYQLQQRQHQLMQQQHQQVPIQYGFPQAPYQNHMISYYPHAQYPGQFAAAPPATYGGFNFSSQFNQVYAQQQPHAAAAVYHQHVQSQQVQGHGQQPPQVQPAPQVQQEQTQQEQPKLQPQVTERKYIIVPKGAWARK